MPISSQKRAKLVEKLKKFLTYEEKRKVYVYDDGLGHPTIGIGLNLDAKGAKDLCKKVGIDYDKVRKDYDDNVKGKVPADRHPQYKIKEEHIDEIFNLKVNEVIDVVNVRINGDKHPNLFEDLSIDWQVALVSHAYNGYTLIGTKIINATRTNDHVALANEIIADAENADSKVKKGLKKRYENEASLITIGKQIKDNDLNLIKDIFKNNEANAIKQLSCDIQDWYKITYNSSKSFLQSSQQSHSIYQLAQSKMTDKTIEMMESLFPPYLHNTVLKAGIAAIAENSDVTALSGVNASSAKICAEMLESKLNDSSKKIFIEMKNEFKGFFKKVNEEFKNISGAIGDLKLNVAESNQLILKVINKLDDIDVIKESLKQSLAFQQNIDQMFTQFAAVADSEAKNGFEHIGKVSKLFEDYMNEIGRHASKDDIRRARDNYFNELNKEKRKAQIFSTTMNTISDAGQLLSIYCTLSGDSQKAAQIQAVVGGLVSIATGIGMRLGLVALSPTAGPLAPLVLIAGGLASIFSLFSDSKPDPVLEEMKTLQKLVVNIYENLTKQLRIHYELSVRIHTLLVMNFATLRNLNTNMGIEIHRTLDSIQKHILMLHQVLIAQGVEKDRLEFNEFRLSALSFLDRFIETKKYEEAGFDTIIDTLIGKIMAAPISNLYQPLITLDNEESIDTNIKAYPTSFLLAFAVNYMKSIKVFPDSMITIANPDELVSRATFFAQYLSRTSMMKKAYFKTSEHIKTLIDYAVNIQTVVKSVQTNEALFHYLFEQHRVARNAYLLQLNMQFDEIRKRRILECKDSIVKFLKKIDFLPVIECVMLLKQNDYRDNHYKFICEIGKYKMYTIHRNFHMPKIIYVLDVDFRIFNLILNHPGHHPKIKDWINPKNDKGKTVNDVLYDTLVSDFGPELFEHAVNNDPEKIMELFNKAFKKAILIPAQQYIQASHPHIDCQENPNDIRKIVTCHDDIYEYFDLKPAYGEMWFSRKKMQFINFLCEVGRQITKETCQEIYTGPKSELKPIAIQLNRILNKISFFTELGFPTDPIPSFIMTQIKNGFHNYLDPLSVSDIIQNLSSHMHNGTMTHDMLLSVICTKGLENKLSDVINNLFERFENYLSVYIEEARNLQKTVGLTVDYPLIENLIEQLKQLLVTYFGIEYNPAKDSENAILNPIINMNVQPIKAEDHIKSIMDVSNSLKKIYWSEISSADSGDYTIEKSTDQQDSIRVRHRLGIFEWNPKTKLLHHDLSKLLTESHSTSTCYWIFTTHNKKSSAINIINHPSSVKDTPVKSINCFTNKNDAENKLKQIFEHKSISKGGIVKAFIFEINLPLDNFISSTRVVSSQPIIKVCNQWWEYFYNREEKQLKITADSEKISKVYEDRVINETKATLNN